MTAIDPVYPATRGITTYESLRPSLDVAAITWVGDSPMSRAIKHFAPGGFHSSLLLNVYGSRLLVEALEHGPTITRASDRFDDYDGDILVHPIEVPRRRAKEIKGTALKMCSSGIRYGYWTLLARALTSSIRNSMHRPICSQTVAYILAKHGVLRPGDEQLVLSPGELRMLLPRPWQLAPYSKEAD